MPRWVNHKINSNKKIPNSNYALNWNLVPKLRDKNLEFYLIDQFAWWETKLLFETSAEIQRIIKAYQAGHFRNVILFGF
jgi:hypothetical protein